MAYFLMDDLGGKNPYFWFNTHIQLINLWSSTYLQVVHGVGPVNWAEIWSVTIRGGFNAFGKNP